MKKIEKPIDPYDDIRRDNPPPSYPIGNKKYDKTNRRMNKERIEKEIEEWEDELPDGIEILQ